MFDNNDNHKMQHNPHEMGIENISSETEPHLGKNDGRFAVGDLIMNRYKVLSELGQGGMGVVYKCFDEIAGVEVALKALPPELSHNTLEMEDIRRNFQIVHNLHHPNIASYNNLERNSANGNYYLIMECCEGEDLRRWIRDKHENGTLNFTEVNSIVQQVATALDYAHSMKIIHRDIKPGNIMIDKLGKIKVLDFGLAAQIHTSMTRVSMVSHGTSGTGPYMAPEQWRGRRQDARADQYALAVMTYEMLAGYLPFESSDVTVLREAVLNETPEPISNIPAYAMATISRAMSKDSAQRFANCSEFAAALSNSSGNVVAVMPISSDSPMIVPQGDIYNQTGQDVYAVPVPPTPPLEHLSDNLKNCIEFAPALSISTGNTTAAPTSPDSPMIITQGYNYNQSAQDFYAVPVPPAPPIELGRNNLKKKHSKLKWLCGTAFILILLGGGALGYYFFKQSQNISKKTYKLPQGESEIKPSSNNNHPAITQDQFERENAALKVELQNKIAQIKSNNYDTEQTFGEKISELETAFSAAKVSKSLSDANKEYKKAKKLADWILLNGELRKECQSLRDLAKNNQTAALEYEPDTYARDLYRQAKNSFREAEKFYNNAEFAAAKKNFEKAVNGFEQAGKTAIDNKLQYLTTEAEKAKKSENWDRVKALAEKIRPLDSGKADEFIEFIKQVKQQKLDNELTAAREAKTKMDWQSVLKHANAALVIDSDSLEAQNLIDKAKNEIKQQKLDSELTAAREAKAKNDWQKVYEHASAVLLIDNNNSEAKDLLQEAEPTLEIIATVDGKRVPAQATIDDVKHDTTEIFKNLHLNCQYKAALRYQNTDDVYIQEFSFTCDWRGCKTMKVDLRKANFDGTVELPNKEKLEMVKVKPGTFIMSKKDGENYPNEKEHKKTITKSFYIGKYEITQAQYKAVMGQNPSTYKADNFPVTDVTWAKAMEFCKKMNKYAPKGWQFTLPTETQWEYAARGGNKSRGYKYSGGDDLHDDKLGWYSGNSSNGIHIVGSKLVSANELGLYDMSGNVWELCLDSYQVDSRKTMAEFTGVTHNKSRNKYCVKRGGAYDCPPKSCRLASRSESRANIGYANTGFRVALVQAE